MAAKSVDKLASLQKIATKIEESKEEMNIDREYKQLQVILQKQTKGTLTRQNKPFSKAMKYRPTNWNI